MAQFLIVQGESREQAESVFGLGVRAFENTARLRPISCVAGATCAAVLPSVKAGSPGILNGERDGEWACGAGTWFFEGASGQEGLRRLESSAREDEAGWLKTLDGAFAIAVLRQGRLLVITDPLGSLHVYATRMGDCHAISTSSLALAAMARPGWDRDACREFLATGTVFESKTLFSGIEKLPPATVVEFAAGGRTSRRKYWNVADAMYDRAPERGNVRRLAETLRDTVATIARNYPKPLLDLTGGFDSRAVLGAALGCGLHFDTVVSGGESDPDVIVSRAIARRFHLPHHHTPPGSPGFAEWWSGVRETLPLCDGELDALAYSRTARAHTRAAESFDASINGSNGEVCKGYWWELLFPYTRRRGHFDAKLIAARRFATERDPDLLDGPFSEPLVDHFAGIIVRANTGLERHPNTAKLDNVYLTLRMQRWQGRIASSTSRIWPCLSPFSFRRPMEAALSAPPGMRLRNRMSRKLIEYLNPELARLPLAEGYPALPLRLTTLHRFWPLARENAHVMGRYLSKRLGRAQSSPPARSPYPFSMAELWRRQEIAGLLDVPSMLTRDLYAPARLREFLAASRREGFGKTHQAGRILTLEMTARAVRGGI